MEELNSCAGCCRKDDKSRMHYDPITKMGETRARYYCDACWNRKNRHFALKAAQRNFRNSAPKSTTINAKYSLF
ncbi:hypothetical protein [Enterobacter asburiae]|uniref:hypothetical protein n=1 Tax=Enterobacter asburiae TaxID=61645 RepID=UPI001CC00508|nr:hypothetical protein [Enterobacter asburiae]UAN38013.1 hypothetical protein KGP18_08855 [Enterobacter asburiae]